jgi:acyl carrier protein
MNRQEKLDFLTSAITNMHKLSIQLTEDIVLASIGLDSLDIVELQLYYEEQTGNETDDPVVPVVSVKDLLDLMT